MMAGEDVGANVHKSEIIGDVELEIAKYGYIVDPPGRMC